MCKTNISLPCWFSSTAYGKQLVPTLNSIQSVVGGGGAGNLLRSGECVRDLVQQEGTEMGLRWETQTIGQIIILQGILHVQVGGYNRRKGKQEKQEGK